MHLLSLSLSLSILLPDISNAATISPSTITVSVLQTFLVDKGFLVIPPGNIKGNFGPLTKTALKNGDIDVGLVFSSDGGIVANNFVVLEDDKHLQNADNIVPIIRTAKLNSEITGIFNKISAALNTTDLTQLNKSADIDKQDPGELAAAWDKLHGFTK